MQPDPSEEELLQLVPRPPAWAGTGQIGVAAGVKPAARVYRLLARLEASGLVRRDDRSRPIRWQRVERTDAA